MHTSPRPPTDAQALPPVTWCALCGSELYTDDVMYCVAGTPICPDCLEAFAAEYFAPQRILAGQVLEENESTVKGV